MTGHVGWTRTLNEDDAMNLLDSVTPGQTMAAFKAQALADLPQAGRDRRVELVRLVWQHLVDTRDDVALPRDYLRLFVGAPPPRRTALLWGRFTSTVPLVADVLATVIEPTLDRAEQPFAAPDAAVLGQAEWDAALATLLRRGAPRSVIDKTRSTLQLVLSRCGILVVTGTRSRSTTVRRGDPDGLAFAWLIAQELRTGHHSEMPERIATASSYAARLFLPTEDRALACLEAGVRGGVLLRSYLMGSARYHAPPGLGGTD